MFFLASTSVCLLSMTLMWISVDLDRCEFPVDPDNSRTWQRRSAHHHHIFVYSIVVTRNSLHRDKKYTKPIDSQQIVQVQSPVIRVNSSLSLYSFFMKKSVVNFGCLVKRLMSVLCLIPGGP